MVDREQVGLQRRLPVHVEQHPPELAGRDRPVGDRLDHIDVAGRRTVLELRMDAIERVAGGLSVELDHDRVLLAASLPAIRRVGQGPRVPPRVGTGEHPRRAESGTLVDRGEHVLRLLERCETYGRSVVGRLAQAGIAARQRHLAGESGEAVAEPAVDDLLRRPERSDRLSALADVLQLGTHHRREDSAATMGGQHPDDGDAAAANRSARGSQLERERARAAHDQVAVERRVHPLERQVRGESLRCLLVRRPPSEVVADRADGAPELLQVPRRPHLPRH